MSIIQCKCDCGTEFEEYDSRGRKRRFIYGHSRKGKHHSPESRQLMSDSHVGIQSGEKNPMYGKRGKNNPNYGKKHSPETKQLMSENHADVSGENHPNWNGGSSKLPYCPIWTNWLKEEIKERDGYRCKNPDCTKITHKLMVHHIDYDKKNCSTDNLITLCNSCNSKANGNREHWKEFYNNILGKSNSYDYLNQK